MKQYSNHWGWRWGLKVTLKLFSSSPGRFCPQVNNNLYNFPERQINRFFKDGRRGFFFLPNTLSDMLVGARIFAMF